LLLLTILLALTDGVMKTLLDLTLLFHNPLEVALRQIVIDTLVLLAVVEVFKRHDSRRLNADQLFSLRHYSAYFGSNPRVDGQILSDPMGTPHPRSSNSAHTFDLFWILSVARITLIAECAYWHQSRHMIQYRVMASFEHPPER